MSPDPLLAGGGWARDYSVSRTGKEVTLKAIRAGGWLGLACETFKLQAQAVVVP